MTPTLRRSTRMAAVVVGLASAAATLLCPATPHVGAIVAPAQPRQSIVAGPHGPEGATTAGAATAARAAAAGYVLATPDLVGITPKGLKVWVDRGAAHHEGIAAHAKATVDIWRKAGINATYGGYGTPKIAEGLVTVTEGPAGCTGGHVGNTWQSWMNLPNGKAYTFSGRVVLCPKLWSYASWQWSATIRHELGHAAGLGHFDGVYGGSTQVMRSVNHAPVATFQSGDLNGLKFLSSHNAYVKAAIPARGKLESSTFASSNVNLTGWALMDYYQDKKVTIAVTDNGKPLTTDTTDVVRADINKLYDIGSTHPHGFVITFPWKGGTHKYCVTAISPVNAATKTDLGCSTWS